MSRDFYDETRDAIASTLDRNAERQRLFRRDMDRKNKLFRKKLTKQLTQGSKERVQRHLAQRNFFDERLVGKPPRADTLEVVLPGDGAVSVLDSLGMGEGDTPNYPAKEFILKSGLSDEGMRAAIQGMPAGWEEHVIGETEAYEQGLDPSILASARAAQELAVIAASGGFMPAANTRHDQGRAYYYNLKNGEIRFTPPPGSTMLIKDAFRAFGRVFKHASGSETEWSRLRHLGARGIIEKHTESESALKKAAALDRYDDGAERLAPEADDAESRERYNYERTINRH